MPEPRFEIKGKQTIQFPVEGPNGSTVYRELNITYIRIPVKDLPLNKYEALPDAIQANVPRHNVPEIDFAAQRKLDDVKKNLIKRIREYKGLDKATNPSYIKQYDTLFKLIEDGSLTLDNVPNELYFSSLKRDFDKYFELVLPYHLYVQRKTRLGEPLVADGEQGMIVAIISGTLGVGSELLYDKKTNQWYSTTQKKYFSSKFYGNQYTPKQKAVVKKAGRLEKGAKIIGLINGLRIAADWARDDISTGWFITEEASNAFSTFGGVYGAAWGIGWELGRLITEQDWYNNAKEQWIYEQWRKENLGY